MKKKGSLGRGAIQALEYSLRALRAELYSVGLFSGRFGDTSASASSSFQDLKQANSSVRLSKSIRQDEYPQQK